LALFAYFFSMKKLITVLLFAFLLPLAVFAQDVAEKLPAPPMGIAKEKYESWCGVMRMWMCEGWESGYGALTPWLNSCIAAFEKRHPGVYIQVKSVSAETMAHFAQDDMIAPDLIVFAPGMLTGAENLAAVSGTVTASLADCGKANGTIRALPIAMGGYAWIYNRSTIKTPPADWSETDFVLRAPADTQSMLPSAALLALCAGTEYAAGGETPRAGSGMDLGLPITGPTPTPAPVQTKLIESRLNNSFLIVENCYGAFLQEEADAILSTQRGIRRLQLADDSGSAPDWGVYTPGEAFSDQLALYAIVNLPREDRAARIEIGQALLDHLLSEECQAKLTQIRALRVTDGPALYTAQNGMAQLEMAYLGKSILAPNAFDQAWRKNAALLFDLFASGQISARAAYTKLTEYLH